MSKRLCESSVDPQHEPVPRSIVPAEAGQWTSPNAGKVGSGRARDSEIIWALEFVEVGALVLLTSGHYDFR